jgi:hypothetical protein
VLAQVPSFFLQRFCQIRALIERENFERTFLPFVSVTIINFDNLKQIIFDPALQHLFSEVAYRPEDYEKEDKIQSPIP